MKGIIVDDLARVIKICNSGATEIDVDITKLKRSLLNVNRCLGYSDLTFLTSKIDEEVKQLTNANNKIGAYSTTLNNVLQAYQEEANELTKIMGNMAP